MTSITAEFLDGAGEQPGSDGRLPDHPLTIVGDHDDPAHLDADEIVAYPGTLPGVAGDPGPSQWLAQVPGGLDWAQVQKLNQNGYSAESLLVAENPPPDSAVPLMRHYRAASAGSSRLTQALVAVVAIASSSCWRWCCWPGRRSRSARAAGGGTSGCWAPPGPMGGGCGGSCWPTGWCSGRPGASSER